MTPPPRRWLPYLVKRATQVLVLSALGLAALLVGWVHSEDFQRRSSALIEHIVETQTGEQITLTRVRVRFWAPALMVEGFHMFRADGDTIASAERIRVPLVLRDGGVKIGKLELQSPVVHLHVDADGKLQEFQGLKRPPPEQRQPLTQLPWSGLHLTDGDVQVDLPQGSVHLFDLQLVPTPSGKLTLDAALDLKVRGLRSHTDLHWPEVSLGPDLISVPTLVIDNDVTHLEGRAAWPLGEAVDVAVSGRVDLEELNPLLTPPREAHGELAFDLQVEGMIDDPEATITVLGTELGIDLPGVLTPLLTYELGTITGAARVNKRGARVEQLTLHWADGQIIAEGTITPDRRLVGAHILGDSVSLRPLLQAFDVAKTPWIDMKTDLEISAEGTLKPLLLEGHFDLAVADLRVTKGPIHLPTSYTMLQVPHAHAHGTLTLEKDHLFVAADRVVGPRSRGSLSVEVGFAPGGPLDLQIDLHDTDLRDFAPLGDIHLRGRGALRGRIWGKFKHLQFAGSGDLRGFEVLGVPYADHLMARLRSPDMKSLLLEEAEATVGSSHYTGSYGIDFRPPMSMRTEVIVDEGRIEDLVGMFIDLEGLTGELEGSLSLAGPFQDMSGEAHFQLSDVDLWGESFETGEAHGYMDTGRFTLDDLRVRRRGGQAGLTLRGSVERAWALNMELIADGLTLEHLDTLAPYELPLSGRISGFAHIGRTLFDPTPDGRLVVSDVRYAGEPVADSVLHFQTLDGVAQLTGDLLGGAARLHGTQGLWETQPYALRLDLKELPAHLFYPLAADGSPVHAIASGEMLLSGHFGQAWSPVTLRSTLSDVEVRWSHHTLHNTQPWFYEQDGRRFKLTGFSLAEEGGITDLQLSASGGEALLMAGNGALDLDLLRAVVPDVERASGRGDVVLYAVGSKPNVEAVIDLNLDADLLRYAYLPVTFEDTKARLRITQDEVQLISLAGGLGGGTFTGSGRIDSEDWYPDRFDIQLDVQDAQVQWVDSLPPAIGDAQLSFDGPTEALLLSGEVDIKEMSFTDRIDWEDWIVEYREEMLVDPGTTYEDDESYFNLNVQINAPDTIILRNNVAEGIASADLRVIGDTARPGLVGEVDFKDGALAFLQDREFRVDRGGLLFNDPWSWDPSLDISLFTDINSRQQRYRVNYLVYGPLSGWKSTTRSDPPLPQADVNALLWFGITMDELEQMGELSSAVFQGVADMMLTDFLVSGQAGEIGEDLIFDRIDLATGVNGRGLYSPEPRLVVEKRLDDLADLDLTWELNLVRPSDSYLSAKQRIGGIWSLSGWYATQQRDRVLPIGGAYGLDVTARWELE